MSTMRLQLKAGERLFLNGAVLSVDRRSTLNLLNKASFLREAHVMQAEEATTPVRRLYFTIQSLMLAPEGDVARTTDASGQAERLLAASARPETTDALLDARDALLRGQHFAALRALRTVFEPEDDEGGRGE